jgi:hypothetical protein
MKWEAVLVLTIVTLTRPFRQAVGIKVATKLPQLDMTV